VLVAVQSFEVRLGTELVEIPINRILLTKRKPRDRDRERPRERERYWYQLLNGFCNVCSFRL